MFGWGLLFVNSVSRGPGGNQVQADDGGAHSHELNLKFGPSFGLLEQKTGGGVPLTDTHVIAKCARLRPASSMILWVPRGPRDLPRKSTAHGGGGNGANAVQEPPTGTLVPPICPGQARERPGPRWAQVPGPGRP